MHARFLLGPAGSGKTFRCLAEIRAALQKNPAGAPLIFLAPKQATFQLERQLLADDSLHGYTRLQIFSFERLAQFVLEKLNVAPPEQLNDEGRVMILRALLMRHERDLKLFSKSARRPGFARQLSQLLNELQQHQFTPQKIRALAQRENLRRELRDKLHDLGLLHEAYANWLAGHDLQDADCLLGFAIDALKKSAKCEARSASAVFISHFPLLISHLWLDGFAEMTPQELDLLAAILPFCESATLAFCLDESGANEKENSWLSIWNVVGKSYQQCRQRIENLPDCKIEIEILRRNSGKSRFAKNAGLALLEANWSKPTQNPKLKFQNSIRTVSCANAESEGIFAAREILKFVRNGARFRDCAVIVRNLENYHKPLAREFRRYDIPFFLDRRESVAHHPLAELTRSALRTTAFDWQQNDLFAALKAGFCVGVQASACGGNRLKPELQREKEIEIDRLENAALEFGWRGKKWREPLSDENLERLRKKILPPLENFSERLAKLKFQPNGRQLAETFRELWHDFDVEKTLENWSASDEGQSQIANPKSQIHSSVWEQMNSWLENLELAFPHETLSLRDWLPILEAGLANLTVGVIPPALDQVLIGAIDRARNPDLKLALVLGVNETIFPATPAAQTILTDADRDELQAPLGPDLRDQISRERFYGYIACTRASEKLVVTFSRRDADGKTLNPSPFIAHLKRIFPSLEIEEFQNEIKLSDTEHASEIAPVLTQLSERRPPARHESRVGVHALACHPDKLKLELQRAVPEAGVPPQFKIEIAKNWNDLLALPVLNELMKNLDALREPDPAENLSPAFAEKLYGSTLRTSVSRLEEFAACPFRFIVRSGLRADERKVFELDARERGSFQHDALKIFHEALSAEGKRWRDITPSEARERIGKIAAAQVEHFHDGLFRDTAETVFAARSLAASLQDFVEVIAGWMRGQYEFDPAAAELGFGGKDDDAPAWEIDLGGGHKLALQGRIDRVDLWRDPNSEDALAVVMDYKSSGRKPDKVLIENGVQLQLIGYLAALRHWKNPQDIFQAARLIPAGVFYINLRGEYKGGGTRDEVLAGAADARKHAYRHAGRFDAGALPQLDRTKAGDQFNYRLTDAGKLYANSTDPMPHAEFEKLLDGVEIQLRDMGEKIFSGVAKVDPYRKGKQTPCEFCDYQAACRIDKWTHPYRVLRAASTPDG